MRQKVLTTLTLAAWTLSCSEVASPPEEFPDRPGQSSPAASTSAVHSIFVRPSSATIGIGDTLRLTARAKPSKDATFEWSSSSPDVAAVSATGLVTGVVPGSATITATSAGQSADAVITVTGEPPPPPPPTTEVLVGAGDIATCGSNEDEATAKLLDGIEGTVFTAGDNAYETGTLDEYNTCYNPTWGRHKARTMPSPGNHEYYTSGAAGYFGYFGSVVGSPSQPYYSYDLGEWHIIALNSNVSMSAGSAQEQWLRADLDASTKQCTIAYWHHPRFSSGTVHGSSTAPQPLWQALYDFGAEIVVSGHEHNYERFAPQTASGSADTARGIREFVVGTGGAPHKNDEGPPLPNSEALNGTTWGVLKLTLGPGTYTWQFVPIAGQTFTDAGSGTCH